MSRESPSFMPVQRNFAKTDIQRLLNVEGLSPEHLGIFAKLDSFNYGD